MSEIQGIQRCTEDQLGQMPHQFGEDEWFSIHYPSSSQLNLQTKSVIPFVVTPEYIDQFCYTEGEDGGVVYHATDAAWEHLRMTMRHVTSAFLADPLQDGIPADSKANPAPLDFPGQTKRYDGELFTVPDIVFGVEDSQVVSMLDNPPLGIPKKYDTDDWKLLSVPMTPRLVAQIRVVLGDKDNELFRASTVENAFFVTTDLESLRLIVDTLNLAVAWFRKPGNGDGPDGMTDLTKARLLSSICENILAHIESLEAMEEGRRDLYIVFGVPSLTALLASSVALWRTLKDKNGRGPKVPPPPPPPVSHRSLMPASDKSTAETAAAAFILAVIAYLIYNDVTGAGAVDDPLLVPTGMVASMMGLDPEVEDIFRSAGLANTGRSAGKTMRATRYIIDESSTNLADHMWFWREEHLLDLGGELYRTAKTLF